MNLVLLQCPCWGIYTPPLALASLCAYLRNKEYTVSVLDLNIDMFYNCKNRYKKFWQEAEHEFWRSEPWVEKFFEDNYELINIYLDKICNFNAKVIGFSIYDTSMFFSLILAREIKKISPDKLIVFGGPHCSKHMAKQYLIFCPEVDIIVEGEGEETLTEILELIKRDGKIDFCGGSLIKKRDKIVNGAERPLIANLDTLPFPDFSDFPIGRYLRADTIPVSTSRGCVNRCIFCNEWPYWKRYRYKSGNYIFQEITHSLTKYPQITNIEFHDSLLNGNLKELSILCDHIIQDGLKIRWSGQAILHRGMDYKLLYKFKKSGCGCLNYGMESGSQKVIDIIRKRVCISEAERIIRQT